MVIQTGRVGSNERFERDGSIHSQRNGRGRIPRDGQRVRQEQDIQRTQMWGIYREVKKQIPAILERCGAGSVFEARAFQEISYAANVAAEKIVG